MKFTSSLLVVMLFSCLNALAGTLSGGVKATGQSAVVLETLPAKAMTPHAWTPPYSSVPAGSTVWCKSEIPMLRCAVNTIDSSAQFSQGKSLRLLSNRLKDFPLPN
jgi:hypothetical protein